MTPAEAFEKLGFSPIIQAVAGLLWFSVVLFVMLRAERTKKTNGGTTTTTTFTPMPHSQMSTPDHFAKLTELSAVSNTLQKQTCEKIAAVHQHLIIIGESLKLIASVREAQIDELIAAIKETRGVMPQIRRWWP